MATINKPWVGVLCLCLAAPVAGCGTSGPRLAPVTGKVTVDGAPVPEAGVSFRADPSKGNATLHIPSGTANAEGMYELVAGGRKGAPPGWYKVVVVPPPPPKIGGEVGKQTAFPFDRKYTSPETTDLMIEVKEGAEPGAYDLKLSK